MIGLGTYVSQAKGVKHMTDHYGGPVGLAGKLIGLGQEELQAGVPWWSWLAVGALIGGVSTYHLRGKIEKVAGA